MTKWWKHLVSWYIQHPSQHILQTWLQDFAAVLLPVPLVTERERLSIVSLVERQHDLFNNDLTHFNNQLSMFWVWYAIQKLFYFELKVDLILCHVRYCRKLIRQQLVFQWDWIWCKNEIHPCNPPTWGRWFLVTIIPPGELQSTFHTENKKILKKYYFEVRHHLH